VHIGMRRADERSASAARIAQSPAPSGHVSAAIAFAVEARHEAGGCAALVQPAHELKIRQGVGNAGQRLTPCTSRSSL